MISWKYFYPFCLVLFTVLCCVPANCLEKESDVVLNLGAPQFSGLSDEQKVLLSELKTGYSLLVNFYENAKIGAELFSPSASTQRFVFRSRGGDHFRMDILKADKPDAPQPKEGDEILFVTPSLFTTIGIGRGSGGTSEFFVNEIQQDRAHEGIGNFASFRFWRAPYCTWFLPIKYCIFVKPDFADHFTVSQLTQRNDGINDLVTIETQYYKGGKIAVAGTFTFYRNLCWALKETKWEFVPEKETRHSFVEYSGEEKGVPLLSKVTYWHVDSGEETPGNQMAKKDVYMCSVITAPIPYSDFDVQQYVKIGSPESNYSYFFLRLTLVILGIVLIAWGLALRLRKK